MEFFIWILATIITNVESLMVREKIQGKIYEKLAKKGYIASITDIVDKRKELDAKKEASEYKNNKKIAEFFIALLPGVNIGYTYIKETLENQKIIKQLKEEDKVKILTEEQLNDLKTLPNSSDRHKYIVELMKQIHIEQQKAQELEKEKSIITVEHNELPNDYTVDEIKQICEETGMSYKLTKLDQHYRALLSKEPLDGKYKRIRFENIFYQVELQIKSIEEPTQLEFGISLLDTKLNENEKLQEVCSKIYKNRKNINHNLVAGDLYLTDKIKGSYSLKEVEELNATSGKTFRVGRCKKENYAVIGIPNKDYEVNRILFDEDDKMTVHEFIEEEPVAFSNQRFNVYSWNSTSLELKQLADKGMEIMKNKYLETLNSNQSEKQQIKIK